MYEYAVGNLVYVEMTGIYYKQHFKKQGLYIIKEVFTNNTLQFQRVQVNEYINIRRLTPNFV